MDSPLHDGRLDRHDLVNLALRAHSGRSIPEIALRHATRFVTDSPGTWIAPTRWRLTFRFPAGRDDGRRPHDNGWTVWPPLSWPSPDRAPAECWRIGGHGAERTIEVLVEGRIEPPPSPVLMSLVREYLADDRRFVSMPPAVQQMGRWMHERRIFDCLTVSVDLQRACTEAGLDARVRRGWYAGLVASPHAWLEVIDLDGRRKIIDVAMHELARTIHPDHPAFQTFCIGSRSNRLLVTDCPAGAPLVEQASGGAFAGAQVSAACIG